MRSGRNKVWIRRVLLLVALGICCFLSFGPQIKELMPGQAVRENKSEIRSSENPEEGIEDQVVEEEWDLLSMPLEEVLDISVVVSINQLPNDRTPKAIHNLIREDME